MGGAEEGRTESEGREEEQVERTREERGKNSVTSTFFI